MTSWAFNPLTIALASVITIFLASILLPADSWDRIKDLAWRAPSLNQPCPPKLDRPMPWERDREEREHASAIMQAQLMGSEDYYQLEARCHYAEKAQQPYVYGVRGKTNLVSATRSDVTEEGGTTPRKDEHAT